MADYLAGFYPEWVDKEENPRQIILDLGKMITNRIPVKLGFQKLNKYDPEYWGLATLLTDEQAEVALKMGVRKRGRTGKDSGRYVLYGHSGVQLGESHPHQAVGPAHVRSRQCGIYQHE